MNDAVPKTVGQLYAAAVSQYAGSDRAIALRRKEWGIWQELNWERLQAEVGRLTVAFREHGIASGSRVLRSGALSARLIEAFLALHWLGAIVVAVEREVSVADLTRLITDGTIEHAFTQDPVVFEGLRLLTERDDSPLRYLWFDGILQSPAAEQRIYRLAELLPGDRDGRVGLSGRAARRGKLPAPAEPSSADPDLAAFEFAQLRNGHPAVTRLTHRALLEGAFRMEAQQRPGPLDRLLLEPTLTPVAFAVLVYGSWLLNRYTLCVPESNAVSVSERKEIGPTFLVGNASHYTQLESWVQERLPETGTWKRRLVDWAFAKYAELNRGETAGEAYPGRFGVKVLVPAVIAWLSVIRPLRIGLGTIRLNEAVLAAEASGDAPGEAVAQHGLHGILGPKPRLWHWDRDSQPGRESSLLTGRAIDVNGTLVNFSEQETVHVVRA